MFIYKVLASQHAILRATRYDNIYLATNTPIQEEH